MRIVSVFLLLFYVSVSFADSRSLKADVWVDNWFELYVNETRVIEDSVSITTERSFNSETKTFTAELPAVIAIVAKDFKENDTGLEYIGSRRQQMGDGGLIFQLKDAQTNDVIAVSNQDMRCLVIHHAPVDRSCADESDPIAGQGACAFESMDEPVGWMSADFDDSDWPQATEHSERDVSPKGGYDNIQWDSSSKLIWSDNLLLDNTLLCRLVVEG